MPVFKELLKSSTEFDELLSIFLHSSKRTSAPCESTLKATMRNISNLATVSENNPTVEIMKLSLNTRSKNSHCASYFEYKKRVSSFEIMYQMLFKYAQSELGSQDRSENHYKGI